MGAPKMHKIADDDHVIKLIDVDALETVYYMEDIDPEDTKSFPRVLNMIKSIVRSSDEYKRLMRFLKEQCDMNQTLFFKGVKATADRKFSIEVHHTPFCMEDIVASVIKKRIAHGESLSYLHIADEIMYLHYEGLIGLVPLDKTTHALVHSDNAPEVFVPLQFIDFGAFHEFYTAYKKYIPATAKDKYAYLRELSIKYERLEDIIPKYMKPKHLYYEGFIRLDSFEKVLGEIEASA